MNKLFDKLDKIYDEITDSADDKIKQVYLLMKPEFLLIRVLSGSAIKLLNMIMLIPSPVKLQYREITDLLGFSTRTVTRAIRELKGYNIIKTIGTKGNIIYEINPAENWKGIFADQQSKLELLRENGKFTILKALSGET